MYEAVQLFQISEFRGTLDNKNYMIDGIHWQTHKSPKEAVLSGEGCCATDTKRSRSVLSFQHRAIQGEEQKRPFLLLPEEKRLCHGDGRAHRRKRRDVLCAPRGRPDGFVFIGTERLRYILCRLQGAEGVIRRNRRGFGG